MSFTKRESKAFSDKSFTPLELCVVVWWIEYGSYDICKIMERFDLTKMEVMKLLVTIQDKGCEVNNIEMNWVQP